MKRELLKKSLRSREKLFGAWVSYAEPSITETFAKAGFNEYVAKPFTESEIIRAINPFVNPGNEVGEWAHF